MAWVRLVFALICKDIWDLDRDEMSRGSYSNTLHIIDTEKPRLPEVLKVQKSYLTKIHDKVLGNFLNWYFKLDFYLSNTPYFYPFKGSEKNYL